MIAKLQGIAYRWVTCLAYIDNIPYRQRFFTSHICNCIVVLARQDCIGTAMCLGHVGLGVSLVAGIKGLQTKVHL